MSFATACVRCSSTAGLAAHFQATLIGACAWEPRPPLTCGGVTVDPKITTDMPRGDYWPTAGRPPL